MADLVSGLISNLVSQSGTRPITHINLLFLWLELNQVGHGKGPCGPMETRKPKGANGVSADQLYTSEHSINRIVNVSADSLHRVTIDAESHQ